MSHAKQPQVQLNGAYYGPPIPPPHPPKSSYRPGRSRSRGCGCCLLDCLCDCGCCLFGCVFKLIFSLLILVGLAILVFWLIVRPHEMRFHATNAHLSSFNLTNPNNTLNYNLAVNFTVRNPNRHIGVYYDQIEASSYYASNRLTTVHAQTFFQGTKNTTSFGPLVFRGQSGLVLGVEDRSNFEQQSSDGVYDVVVRLNLRVRFKLGLFKTGTYKPKVRCNLKVPFNGGRSSDSQQFQTTRCDYDLF